MKVKFSQLAAQLKSGLAPIYLLYGDEPLQLAEAADMIRRACRERGFEERQVYAVLPGFDWNLLAGEADALSLFSANRLLEVRVPEGKVGKEGARVLTHYAERPPEATVLLLTLENLASGEQKKRWFARLEATGVAVQTRSPEGRDFKAWLAHRAKSRDVRLHPEAIQLLAVRTEGNLLAAAQEIDKLYVLYGGAEVDADLLAETVADSARFDVFDLTEALLSGQVHRVDRTLAGLRAEGMAPAVVLWAITRELRLLLQLGEDRRRGVPITASCRRLRLWERRRIQLERALKRLSRFQLHAAIKSAARIDAVIKGRVGGDAWEQLRDVCLALASGDATPGNPEKLLYE
ncbi:DNA polymerase III subunit delta [Methylohalobius crimeensis]|uniref:DNA polymerase III subunit delta n=1 Tax=Methylohalobius crimeensis TaxID=244365 RepID=UPI0003B7289F|nr:DNA polymerase III subunit delta [Methylohalobius crimeensis]